jgi:tetratricopeptide (TPR) repeat protein
VTPVTTISDEAREALRLTDDDPRRSIALAADAAARARQVVDHATATVAQRAWGLGALALQDANAAVRHLRKSLDHGRRAGSSLLMGEARMSLAFALNEQGATDQAMQEIEVALAELEQEGVPHLRALAQRAGILQQQSSFEEAIAGYGLVLPGLRRAGDRRWVWRVLSNRGVARTRRYEFALAERDLREAERLSRELGLRLALAATHANLGFVNAIRGDVPAALQYLDLAQQGLEQLGIPFGVVLADRSELLLSLQLAEEALELAERAVEQLGQGRRRLGLAEARLLLARAAILSGKPSVGLGEGLRALHQFNGQKRRRWAELAQFSVLAARLAGPRRAQVRLVEVERVADRLDAAGWPSAAIEARVQAARLALERKQVERGQRQLRLASRHRAHGPASRRARAWYAEALLRQSSGQWPGAAMAAAAGLRVLDQHRATLGATDLRAAISGQRTELAELGLRVALRQGSPRRVLAWAERGRASHLLMNPVRPPDDPTIASALGELRVTVMEIGMDRLSGAPDVGKVKRVVAIEADIRGHLWRLPGEAALEASRPPPLDHLAEELGQAGLVEFVQLDGMIYGLVMIDGRVQLRPLGAEGPVTRLVEWLQFTLRILASAHTLPASRIAAARHLEEAAARLDATLLAPFATQLRDRDLVLVPTGVLQSVPWSVLPSCAGRPVTVAPSASLWRMARRRPSRSAGQVVVAAGPGLPGARAEAETVARLHPRTTALLGAAATVDAVMASLDGAELAHLATHGTVRADNPLFSSLQLVDGPLTLYDLERLRQAPRTVVLAACDSAQAVVRPGDELLGFSATFLTRGTRQLIASVVPVPDAPTAPLMIAFHRLLAAGHPPAAALARAQRAAAREGTSAMAAAAGFVCIGAGLEAWPSGEAR